MENTSLQILWEDDERVVYRGRRQGADGRWKAVLVVLPVAGHPSRPSLDRLAHEYELKDELDSAWAVRPLELGHESGRTMLVLEDPAASRSSASSATRWNLALSRACRCHCLGRSARFTSAA